MTLQAWLKENTMRKRQWIAVGTASAISIALLGSHALGQTQPAQPAKDINPPVANCNVTPDNFDPKDPNDPDKRLPTPINAGLLTSGQPCQQIVNPKGPVRSTEPNAGLRNLQRGFDFYSWLTFIALNSPADGKTIGQGPKPGGDAPAKWEALSNYRPLADVMLADGSKPKWGERIVPDKCKPLDAPGKIILQLGEAAWNQPFKTGPLIDQGGHYALFEILMNEPMFEFIATKGLYSKQGQERFDEDIQFPMGFKPGAPKAGDPGRMGAVMLKVSWRILDPEKDKNLIPQFHTIDALVYFPGGGAEKGTKNGPDCVPKTLGLIGFHVGHKTNFAPQWVWSSFEHVANAPSEDDIKTKQLLPRYNFFSAACKGPECAPNQTPPDPWDPPTSLKFHSGYKSQVVRDNILPDAVAKEVADLNKQFRGILKGTVWENYKLLATQWPSDHASKIDPTGAPAPTFLANTTLETYSQGKIPLASSSCMACHGNATSHHQPATPSDFTFILEKAQSEKK
jgi:hypothetical protein